jgi:hypothetical protein
MPRGAVQLRSSYSTFLGSNTAGASGHYTDGLATCPSNQANGLADAASPRSGPYGGGGSSVAAVTTSKYGSDAWEQRGLCKMRCSSAMAAALPPPWTMQLSLMRSASSWDGGASVPEATQSSEEHWPSAPHAHASSGLVGAGPTTGLAGVRHRGASPPVDKNVSPHSPSAAGMPQAHMSTAPRPLSPLEGPSVWPEAPVEVEKSVWKSAMVKQMELHKQLHEQLQVRPPACATLPQHGCLSGLTCLTALVLLLLEWHGRAVSVLALDGPAICCCACTEA